jgi:hypothetical protein
VTPRYKPNWNGSEGEVLLGYVGPLDIYFEHNEADDEDWIIVVGPDERQMRPRSEAYNFDVYDIVEGGRIVPNPNSPPDIHVELAEMCEIYALAISLGYMEEQ